MTFLFSSDKSAAFILLVIKPLKRSDSQCGGVCDSHLVVRLLFFLLINKCVGLRIKWSFAIKGNKIGKTTCVMCLNCFCPTASKMKIKKKFMGIVCYWMIHRYCDWGMKPEAITAAPVIWIFPFSTISTIFGFIFRPLLKSGWASSLLHLLFVSVPQQRAWWLCER